MSNRFYFVFLLVLLHPLVSYGADSKEGLSKKQKVTHRSAFLLDGATLPELTSIIKLRVETRNSLSKKFPNQYYLFTLHASENQFNLEKYMRFVSELNQCAGQRALELAEPPKSKFKKTKVRPNQWKFQLGDAYLQQVMKYPAGLVVVQVTQYGRGYFLTGMGTLHSFQVWVDGFSWNSSSDSVETSPRDGASGGDEEDAKGPRSIESWLRGLPSETKRDASSGVFRSVASSTLTEFGTLAEVLLLVALGGGGEILSRLEEQAKLARYEGVVLSTLKGALGFYQHQGYLLVDSPTAIHRCEESEKGQKMPYCHPFTREEPVTQADISTFLAKRFE